MLYSRAHCDRGRVVLNSVEANVFLQTLFHIIYILLSVYLLTIIHHSFVHQSHVLVKLMITSVQARHLNNPRSCTLNCRTEQDQRRSKKIKKHLDTIFHLHSLLHHPLNYDIMLFELSHITMFVHIAQSSTSHLRPITSLHIIAHRDYKNLILHSSLSVTVLLSYSSDSSYSHQLLYLICCIHDSLI